MRDTTFYMVPVSYTHLDVYKRQSLEGLIRIVKCGGKFGFYSAHSSNAFFTATFISFLLKKKYKYLPSFLFFWASVVAVSYTHLDVYKRHP